MRTLFHIIYDIILVTLGHEVLKFDSSKVLDFLRIARYTQIIPGITSFTYWKVHGVNSIASL